MYLKVNNQLLKLAVDIKLVLFVDQGVTSFCIGLQGGVDTQLESHRHYRHYCIFLIFISALLMKPHWQRSSLRTCSFGFPARKGVRHLSVLGLSQGLVYTIPYITQQVWSTYTTNTPTIRVVNDVFRNMVLAFASLRCLLRLAEEPAARLPASEMRREG